MSRNKKQNADYLEKEVSLNSKSRALELLADDSDDDFDLESFIKSVGTKDPKPKEIISDNDNDDNDDNDNSINNDENEKEINENENKNILNNFEKNKNENEDKIKKIKKELDTNLEETYLTLPSSSFLNQSNQINITMQINTLPNIIIDSSCPSILANVFTTYSDLIFCLQLDFLTKWCKKTSSLIPDCIMKALFQLSHYWVNNKLSYEATRNINLIILEKFSTWIPSYQDIETALISFGFNQTVHKSDKLPAAVIPSISNTSSSSVVILEPIKSELIIEETIADIEIPNEIIKSQKELLFPIIDDYFEDINDDKKISAQIISKIKNPEGKACCYGDIKEDLKKLGWFTGNYRTTPGRTGLTDTSVFAPWCIERAPEFINKMKMNSNNNIKGEIKYATIEKLIINLDYFPEGHTEELLIILLDIYDFNKSSKELSEIKTDSKIVEDKIKDILKKDKNKTAEKRKDIIINEMDRNERRIVEEEKYEEEKDKEKKNQESIISYNMYKFETLNNWFNSIEFLSINFIPVIDDYEEKSEIIKYLCRALFIINADRIIQKSLLSSIESIINTMLILLINNYNDNKNIFISQFIDEFINDENISLLSLSYIALSINIYSNKKDYTVMCNFISVFSRKCINRFIKENSFIDMEINEYSQKEYDLTPPESISHILEEIIKNQKEYNFYYQKHITWLFSFFTVVHLYITSNVDLNGNEIKHLIVNCQNLLNIISKYNGYHDTIEKISNIIYLIETSLSDR